MTQDSHAYRVTVRYYGDSQRYEILEIMAKNVREAMTRAADRIATRVAETADLVEIRLANPSGG